MLERRPAAHRPSGWSGTCCIGDESPLGHWRDCAVGDISPSGLSLTVRDDRVRPSQLVGSTVTVEFPRTSDWVSIRVEGLIRSAALVQTGLIRAAIDFVGLSEPERAIATVLGVLTTIDEEWAESHAPPQPALGTRPAPALQPQAIA